MKIKKKSSFFSLFVFFMVLIIAFLFATVINNVFIKTNLSNKKNINKGNISYDKASYVVLQCGIYKNKDSIPNVQKSLSDYGNSFVVQSDGNNKVILGIYNKPDGDKLQSTLKKNGVDNIEKSFNFVERDTCDKEIVEMINADITILNKLSDKNVMGVQTKEIKKWVNSLQKVDSKSKNYKVFMQLEKYIQSLPEEITKDKAAENYTFLYNLLNNMK